MIDILRIYVRSGYPKVVFSRKSVYERDTNRVFLFVLNDLGD